MKKGIVILIVVLLIISGIFFQILFSNTLYNDIYENDDRITSIADSYSYRNRVGKSKNKETTLSFQLNGMETLWEIKSDFDTNISIEYSSQIEKGMLKLVLIDSDQTIQKIFEGSGEDLVSVSLKKGSSRIKVIGRNAKGKIDFKILTPEAIRVIPRN